MGGGLRFFEGRERGAVEIEGIERWRRRRERRRREVDIIVWFLRVGGGGKSKGVSKGCCCVVVYVVVYGCFCRVKDVCSSLLAITIPDSVTMICNGIILRLLLPRGYHNPGRSDHAS